MKSVILAGGLGTRLGTLTTQIPKPMVRIGEEPILWHLMKHYETYGIQEFIIALGYQSTSIKQYFLDYCSMHSDFSIDLSNNRSERYQKKIPPWKVHLVETGLHTPTGGRLKMLKKWIQDETFCMTYGDGLSNVDLSKLIAFHKSHGRLATVTAVRPSARFGELVLENEQVVEFSEKSQIREGWINGGFFVLEPQVLDFIEHEKIIWEQSPLERLAQVGELRAYFHNGFWQPMDTPREHRFLESLWESGSAPWSQPS